MKILFDQGTPVPLRKYLENHTTNTAYELGWSNLKNGELLNSAEKEGFELLITTDKNLKYQQNLKTRKIAILVLGTTSWPKLKLKINQILEAINVIIDGDYTEIQF